MYKRYGLKTSTSDEVRQGFFFHDIAKPLAEISKMHQQSCLTEKDHPEITSCKPIYHGNPVICNLCSHSAKIAWRLQTKQDAMERTLWRRGCGTDYL